MRDVVNPGWSHFERFTFAPAVRSGNLLFVSGLTASSEQGEILHPGDIVGQTRCIFAKLGEILAEAGASFDDVVFTRDYITTTVGYRDSAVVRREVFGTTFPAATGVIVAGLLRPGALIEIDAVVELRDVA